MHSVRIELAKLILVGSRITYQATGDAGMQRNNTAVFTNWPSVDKMVDCPLYFFIPSFFEKITRWSGLGLGL